MKLLTQTTLSYLLITLVAFGLGGIYTYQTFEIEVQKETDWYIREELSNLFLAIEKGAPIEALENQKVKIRRLGIQHQEIAPIFSDTLMIHPVTKKMESFRKASMIKVLDGQLYHVRVVDLVVESDDINDGVVRSLSRVFIVLALVIIVASVILSRFLFKPFDNTLREIRQFQLKDHSALDLPDTFTTEFRQLNAFLRRMTGKMQQDYRNLKEFTENASHEMQTPLAIAKGKLELLVENGDLNEEQMKMVDAAYKSISKLSRLGRSLSLLTKIENYEFSNEKELNFSSLLEDQLYNFQELISLRELQLEVEIEPQVKILLHAHLADMLLTNLLQNAVRHNITEGTIHVKLHPGELVIRNTGLAPQVPPSDLFQRFKKSNQSAESLGLGLAIVDKICTVSQLNINYQYNEGWHTFRVHWSEDQ